MSAVRYDVDLRGQVGLVTGGGRGVGQVLALGLARAGMAVGVLARTAAEVEETAEVIVREDGRAIPLTADVTDPEAMESTVAKTEREFGPIDLLVTAAGMSSNLGPVWETDPNLWKREIEVNLGGTYVSTRAVLPGMLERRRGRIVAVASTSGISRGEFFSAYTVSKTGVIRFVEGLAAEVREHGISAFAICPGLLKTRMNLDYLPGIRSYLAASHRFEAPAFRELAARAQEAFTSDSAWTPTEWPVRLVLSLASGRADALSGRFLMSTKDLDGLDDLIRRAEEITRDDLYTMRLRK